LIVVAPAEVKLHTLAFASYTGKICQRWRGLRYGPIKENGQWRIKTNAELITKYKSQDIITVIKIRRLEWLGHVIRIDETGCVKKVFEGKLEGRRGRGRPRLRWINDVEGDLRKFGVKRWRTKE
jgi:hypothetical protein